MHKENIILRYSIVVCKTVNEKKIKLLLLLLGVKNSSELAIKKNTFMYYDIYQKSVEICFFIHLKISIIKRVINKYHNC